MHQKWLVGRYSNSAPHVGDRRFKASLLDAAFLAVYRCVFVQEGMNLACSKACENVWQREEGRRECPGLA